MKVENKVTPNEEQIKGFMGGDTDTPIHMVNLLKFKDKAEYPYDLLTDSDKSASTAFGVVTSDTGKPNRVSVLIAPDGTIAKTYSTVAPAEHAEEVLADLAGLG